MANMKPPTEQNVADQIWGLQRTQAEEVFCRLDVIEFALGKEEAAKLVAGGKEGIISFSQKKSKGANLVQAMKAKGEISTGNLACFDREILLEAMLGRQEHLHSPETE